MPGSLTSNTEPLTQGVLTGCGPAWLPEAISDLAFDNSRNLDIPRYAAVVVKIISAHMPNIATV
jgi:hypothetical protein